MKKILILSSVILLAVGFTGCTPITKTEGVMQGSTYQIFTKDDGSNISWIQLRGSKYGESRLDAKTTQEALMFSLRVAALDVRKKGYNYFAVVNDGSNNLEGFPINRAKDYAKYITLADTDPDKQFKTRGRMGRIGGATVSPIRGMTGRVNLRYKPVKDALKDTVFAVWSVEQTLRDTK